MIRFGRVLPVAVALATMLTACQTRDRIPNPPEVRSAPDTGPGLEPVYGQWEADKPVQLRAQPNASAPVVATIGAGQALKVIGRARNSDWLAVQTGGTTGYVRLHLVRLKGSAPSGSRGTTTTLAKPVDNAGPTIKAAPRSKIQGEPVAN